VSSSEALEHLLAEPKVDLVVLDIGLPGEDGFSAAARLRSKVARATPADVLPLRDRPGTGYVFLVEKEPSP
jgi:CheY-like chemotaxis protein